MELKELYFSDMEMVKNYFYLFSAKNLGMMIGQMRNN